jgi:hypothetical protein
VRAWQKARYRYSEYRGNGVTKYTERQRRGEEKRRGENGKDRKEVVDEGRTKGGRGVGGGK